jgi:hypothetical protein
MESESEKEESPFSHFKNPRQRAFLAALIRVGGNVREACKAAKIDDGTPYGPLWRKDPVFQAAVAEAKMMGAELLESEAIRRAYEGVEEPTGWYRGEAGGVIRKYSDVLLIFLLKAAMPNKYADRIDPRPATEAARQIVEAIREIRRTDGIDNAA